MIQDIHSHIISKTPENQILSFCHKDKDSESFKNARYISVGIHPWFLDEDNINIQLDWIHKVVETDNRVVAIGECGLDKVCGTSMELQTKAFLMMTELSRSANIPLIIHCVKSFNEIIRFKNTINPLLPWIIHGFRGKKELARQLIQQGFYISIGEKFQPEALQAIPSDKLLVETDESHNSIDLIINQISESIMVSNEKIRACMSENAHFLFFSE